MNCALTAVSVYVLKSQCFTEDRKIVYVEGVRIERLTEKIAVYNLEIGKLHTYFMADGVLVHNLCKVGKVSETADKIISKEKKGSIRS